MSIESILRELLPDVAVISTQNAVVTITSAATGKQIFDAEAELRKHTNIKYELMMARTEDKNKLRIKLAKFRGVGDAT